MKGADGFATGCGLYDPSMPPRLAVQEIGSGKPLVLLHGIATDRHIWDLVVPTLASSRRVVTLDLPGFGQSQPVDGGFELDAVAERIARGLAGRGLRGPIDLVGHSLGGGVAITLAALRPRLIGRLILVAPAGMRPFPAPISRLLASSADVALSARRRAVSLSQLTWGRRLLLAMTAADGGGLPPTLARQMVEASSTARRTQAALATITSSDLRPVLASLTTPLGAIWGESDRTVPLRGLDELTSARSDARVVRLPGAGHVPMVEQPQQFADALELLLHELR
jgi:pimeloyl-ACP methyl ester carboxylesterase